MSLEPGTGACYWRLLPVMSSRLQAEHATGITEIAHTYESYCRTDQGNPKHTYGRIGTTCHPQIS
jgi:hypothetical protein